jgi:hypothetical protein
MPHAEGMTKTEAKWAERVRQWRASGQAAAEFARGEGYAPTTLWHWASVLKGQLKTGTKRTKPRAARVRVRMVRVRRVADPSTVPIVIQVGAARVEVRAGFDEGLLRAVVEAIQTTP